MKFFTGFMSSVVTVFIIALGGATLFKMVLSPDDYPLWMGVGYVVFNLAFKVADIVEEKVRDGF